ncbi:peptidylprolyl isomerase [Histomonas meleagridis]|uniref:peptidylprolyl isomerase n=1 Tax=Histomonas meleagridis TaxID=135588 RepID=UPI00355A396E|nr:peptidylprolyl isomerase [Histomonas meleagridis]KAH0801534.1 peptidylprolyl isomerase [Histomonas meleagridis]
METKENPKVYFEISVNGKDVGKVIMELRADVVPKTAENFRCLCTGEKGIGNCGKWLCYKGCKIHRIIPGFVAQGGDFVNGNGTGGESIYGPQFFDDENFTLKHDGEGVLSMANSGPNKNRSQFFITYSPKPHLDGKHVVFGRVVEGMEVIRDIEKYGTEGKGATTANIIISECGEVGGKSASENVPPSLKKHHKKKSKSKKGGCEVY